LVSFLHCQISFPIKESISALTKNHGGAWFAKGDIWQTLQDEFNVSVKEKENFEQELQQAVEESQLDKQAESGQYCIHGTLNSDRSSTEDEETKSGSEEKKPKQKTSKKRKRAASAPSPRKDRKTAPDFEVPSDFIIEKIVRQSGQTAGRVDTYWYTPDRKAKFRSRLEIQRYLNDIPKRTPRSQKKKGTKSKTTSKSKSKTKTKTKPKPKPKTRTPKPKSKSKSSIASEEIAKPTSVGSSGEDGTEMWAESLEVPQVYDFEIKLPQISAEGMLEGYIESLSHDSDDTKDHEVEQ